MREKRPFMVVVGGSAGGLNAACKVLGQLKKEINAVIVIILHLPERGDSAVLNSRLQRSTLLPCEVAGDKMAFTKGHVYLAPAGHHLLIGKKEFLFGRGPAESGWRPSLDTSFRSAAAAWDGHCIGVVLSGFLSDGTAGMEAIRRCGGRTIVQDPANAEYPNMPASVLRSTGADACVPLEGMGKAITAAIGRRPRTASVPEDILLETRLAENAATAADSSLPYAPTVYACPECGGVLCEASGGKLTRYRCHIGHEYTEAQLLIAQNREVEETLWVALRTLEEKKTLLENMSRRETKQGFRTLAEGHDLQARDIRRHIGRMKELINVVQTDTGD